MALARVEDGVPDALGLGGRHDQFVTILARITGAADDSVDVAEHTPHREMVILDRLEGLIEKGLNCHQRLGPLHGDHGRVRSAVVKVADGSLAVLLELGQHGGPVGRVTDQVVAVLVAIDQDVVDQPALIVGHQAVLDLVGIQLRDLVGGDPLQPGQHSRAVEGEAAHVADVKDPHPLPHGLVLGDDGRVLHGHQPAAELDDPAAVGLVPIEEGCLEQGRLLSHGAVSGGRDSPVSS